jgi:PKD repeat protein
VYATGIITVTLTATNLAGSNSKIFSFLVMDCMLETLPAFPELDDHYVVLGDSKEVKLLSSDWVIGDSADTYCTDYIIRIVVYRSSDNASYN